MDRSPGSVFPKRRRLAPYAALAVAAWMGWACHPRPREASPVPSRDVPAAVTEATGSLGSGDDTLKAGYRTFRIEGSTVLVSQAVLAHPEVSAQVMERVRERLSDARSLMGPGASQVISQVKIWVEWQSGDPRPRGPAEFHQSARWLIENGYDPEKEHGVEINNALAFLRATAFDQPEALLHELSHAYDALVFHNENPAIEAAYQSALAGRRYDAVTRVGANVKLRAYALTNAREYFAETSESYLGMNDFEPFVREELETFDPAGFALMQSVWGARGPRARGGVLPCAPSRSPEAGPPTALVIHNRSTHSVALSWLDGGGSRVSMRSIGAGSIGVQPTYVGHLFEVRDGVTGACLGSIRGALDVERIEL